MKRRDLYQRMSLLEKINAGTNKARSLVEQRALLQEQRKLANMEASFQRQRLQARPHSAGSRFLSLVSAMRARQQTCSGRLAACSFVTAPQLGWPTGGVLYVGEASL